ncbi:MAG: hypothetical protein RQ760_06170 [Sedimentisphaerales bacterium]|nr:hypothetical protein [Sedimentisphaerales bacterium]
MNNNSLFEILAILIGFAGIMLILSLLVTALTQAVAHFLSIRANNLQAGLAELLATAQEEGVGASLARAEKDCEVKHMAVVEAQATADSLEKKGKATSKDISEADGKVAKAEFAYEEANKTLEKMKASITPDDQKPLSESEKKEIIKKAKTTAEDILKSNSLMEQGKIGFLPKFMAPKASWILKEELEILLWEQSLNRSELTEEVIEKTKSWFSRMEKGLSQRFNIIMRCITLGCALLVAVVFQVSAPDVLKRLSTDPEFRAKAETAAVQFADKFETDYSELIKYENTSAKALEELQKKHSDLQETIEEASGIGDTKADILKELSAILADDPRQKELVLEYESILDKFHREGYEKASEMIEESVGALALFDITPWPEGWKFYWNIQNILGVLMTAILIGLGAPFWFSTLKKLVALRDLLAPEENKKGKETKSKDQ